MIHCRYVFMASEKSQEKYSSLCLGNITDKLMSKHVDMHDFAEIILRL